MTKKWFLQRLRFALWGGFKRSERRDIITDYESFFTQELTNGLSETAIVIELGEPTAIAINLARESGKREPIGTLVLKYLEQICFFFGIIAFFGTLLIYHNMREYKFGNDILIISGAISLTLMSLSLYFTLKAKITIPDFQRGFIGLLFTNAVIFALASFCCLFFNSKASLDFAFWVLENCQSQHITNGLSEVCLVFLIVAISIGLWAIFGVWRGKAERFITAIHAVGFCVYLETVYKVWRSSSDIGLYWERIARTGLIYGIVIIITIVSAFALALKARDKGAVTNGK